MNDIRVLCGQILSQARQEAAGIRKDAELQAEQTLEVAKTQWTEERRAANKEAERVYRDATDRLLSATRLDMRRQMLAARQQILDEAFQAVAKRFAKMSAEEYASAMLRFAVLATETGDERLVISRKDESRLGQPFIDELNRTLTGLGKMGAITLDSGKGDFQGGFLLRSPDGSREMNVTLEAILRLQRERLEADVARMLFREAE